MLRHLGCHENIISLYDVVTMPYVSVVMGGDGVVAGRVHGYLHHHPTIRV